MVFFLLSKDENAYLNEIKKGTLKPIDMLESSKRTPESQRRRNMHCKIRKKVKRTMRDLTLIFETLTLSELRFYNDDYLDLFFPMLTTIQKSKFTATRYWKDRQNERLSYTLESAGKGYDYKRLVSDEKYRQRLIDWLVENHVNVQPYPITPTDEKKFFEEITRDKVLTVIETLTQNDVKPITLTLLLNKLELNEGSGRMLLHKIMNRLENEGRVVSKVVVNKETKQKQRIYSFNA